MQNGKGDKYRPTNISEYNKNHDLISWGKKEQIKCSNCQTAPNETDNLSKIRFVCGEWICRRCFLN